MMSPPGWQEPGQRPEFEEITVVLRGMLRVEHEGGTLDVRAGQADRDRAGRVGPLQHARSRTARSTSPSACPRSRRQPSTATRPDLSRTSSGPPGFGRDIGGAATFPRMLALVHAFRSDFPGVLEPGDRPASESRTRSRSRSPSGSAANTYGSPGTELPLCSSPCPRPARTALAAAAPRPFGFCSRNPKCAMPPDVPAFVVDRLLRTRSRPRLPGVCSWTKPVDRGTPRPSRRPRW